MPAVFAFKNLALTSSALLGASGLLYLANADYITRNFFAGLAPSGPGRRQTNFIQQGHGALSFGAGALACYLAYHADAHDEHAKWALTTLHASMGAFLAYAIVSGKESGVNVQGTIPFAALHFILCACFQFTK